jgi:hypothetical protein
MPRVDIFLPISSIVMLFKWINWYFTYLTFLYRCFLTKCPHIVDYRFCKDKDCNFPFRKCGEIVAKDHCNKEVKLEYVALERINNLGVRGCKILYIDNIKKFCRLPRNIESINCTLFPWEVSNTMSFRIDREGYNCSRLLIPNGCD